MFARSMRAHVMQLPMPSAWDELSARQFVRIASLLSTHKGSDLMARISWELLDISWRTPRRLASLFLGLNPEERHRLVKCSKPFLLPAGLVNTPLTVLHAGRTELHCAYTDILNQCDAETWGLVDTAFMRYNRTQDVDMLRYMAQALYAPNGATREQRLHQGISANLVKLVPLAELHALHIMWAGHRLQLAEDAPWVFRKVQQKRAERKKRGWVDVLLAMSGGKFGPYHQVSTTPARVFLRELSDSIDRATQRKHQEEAARNQRNARRR